MVSQSTDIRFTIPPIEPSRFDFASCFNDFLYISPTRADLIFIPIVNTREKYVASKHDFWQVPQEPFELVRPAVRTTLDTLSLQRALMKNIIEIINPI